MDPILTTIRQKMEKALAILSQDLGTIRAGRSNPQLVENVRVKVYGGTQELAIFELATITSSGPQTLILTPFDVAIATEIEKGLMQANLGLSISNEGELIRIKLPPLTEERRNEFVKLAKTKTEGVRIMVRQIRHEGISNIRRRFDAKEIGEDVKFRLEKDVQKITDGIMEKIDQLLESKVAELTNV